MSIELSRVEKNKLKKKEKKRQIKSILRDVIIALFISFCILFVVSPSLVKEHSMQPTIDDGDVVLLNKLFYSKVERGDIVVFETESLDEQGKKMRLIKRVIGIAGDKITISNGKVKVNGKEIEEKYIYNLATGNVNDYIVPKDSFYALGDHREVSRDSRQLGAIKNDRLVGKVFFRIFPFNKIGGVE